MNEIFILETLGYVLSPLDNQKARKLIDEVASPLVSLFL
jgi:hypothetical protein